MFFVPNRIFSVTSRACGNEALHTSVWVALANFGVRAKAGGALNAAQAIPIPTQITTSCSLKSDRDGPNRRRLVTSGRGHAAAVGPRRLRRIARILPRRVRTSMSPPVLPLADCISEPHELCSAAQPDLARLGQQSSSKARCALRTLRHVSWWNFDWAPTIGDRAVDGKSASRVRAVSRTPTVLVAHLAEIATPPVVGEVRVRIVRADVLSGIQVENCIQDLTSTHARPRAFDVDPPWIVAAVVRVGNARAEKAAASDRGLCSAVRQRRGAE